MKSPLFCLLRISILYFVIVLFPLPLVAADLASLSKESPLSSGQTLYVPAYSHIYSGNKARPFLLTVTLSVRNVDPDHAITITEVNYYETQGTHIKSFLDQPVVVKPFESLRYLIPEKDNTGGSGANFTVKWNSIAPVNPPLVETIMIGTQGQQGISFTSRSVVIHSNEPPKN